MTRDTQKQRERQILNFYLQKVKLSAIVLQGPEPPDFVLEIEGRRIGVEVMEYHQQFKTSDGYSRREVEAAWKKVRDYIATFRRSRREFDSLSVLLWFKAIRVPSSGEMPRFVEELAVVLAKVRPAPNSESVRVELSSFDSSTLKKYVHAITVAYVEAYMEPDWIILPDRLVRMTKNWFLR